MRSKSLYPILGCLLLLAARGGADTLVLKEEAYVRGPKILLSDLAEINGDHAAELASIEVSAAPMPGGAKNINASLIQARLRSAGVNTETIAIEGASRVRTTTMSVEISRSRIAESLRLFIQNEMPWEAEATEIDVPEPIDDLTLGEGHIEIEWQANPTYQYKGSGTFRGSIFVDGRAEKTLLCKATVTPYIDAVVARTDIPRGRPLSPQQLEVRKMSALEAPAGALRNIGEAMGLMSKKTIFAGQAIGARNCEAPVVVRRNQLVSIEISTGGLHIQGRAKAMSEGRVGDVVLCQNLNSKERFQGVVRQDGVVVVP